MPSIMDVYRSKLISADDAAAMAKSGDTVDFYAFTASSQYMDAALAKRAGELENVTIRTELRLAPPLATWQADPQGKTFVFDSLFRGPLENMVAVPQRTVTPARLSRFESIFDAGELAVDIEAFMVSPPDDEGYVHFCPSPAIAKVGIRTARLFIAEINENLFPLRGTEDRRIHLSEVDYVVEGNNPPIMEIPSQPVDDTARRIADHIVSELSDGACLQIGYGAVPDAVAALIGQSGLQDLGIHTEFMGDGIMRLYESGKVTGARKNIDTGKMVAGIAFGSHAFYDFVRDCPDLYLSSSTYSNDPDILSRNDNVISVNAFLGIDLTGQVSAESIGTHVVSGTGGQLDFVIGAQMSKDGKAILCAPATYQKKDGSTASRIVPALRSGEVVTTPRSCVHHVATEFGIVNLRGRNLWDRTELLVSIAHPDFRDELIREAGEMGIWRKRNR